MSMLCFSRSHQWIEQEIIEPSVFQRSLEVIEEQSMEINEEREEPRLKKSDNILEEDQTTALGKFENHLMNLVNASIQD